MRIVVTGADGFLGWHVRCRLAALTDHQVVAVGRADIDKLEMIASGADALLHLAGVNRGTDAEVEDGNVALAKIVARAVRRCNVPRVVYANSVHAADPTTPYGRGKLAAADVLADAPEPRGLVDVRLPNLFGEHGRPRYNSFVATFCHELAAGRMPKVMDNELPLMHAQAAAEVLLGALEGDEPAVVSPKVPARSVADVFDRLVLFRDTYRRAEIPPLLDQFDVDLFNTFRSSVFPAWSPMELPVRSDERGALVECVKAHGGQGQTFASTTRPGFTRGQHYHLGKVERFLVVSGDAEISLRRLFHTDVTTFRVSGETPVAVDMPTMWAHSITNVGDDDLMTLFWTNTVFDPDHPDTYPHDVAVTEAVTL